MAGDGSVDKAVAFDQEHSELVLNVDWWWAVHICLCAIAVVANLIFIITVIHNRYETSSDFYFKVDDVDRVYSIPLELPQISRDDQSDMI